MPENIIEEVLENEEVVVEVAEKVLTKTQGIIIGVAGAAAGLVAGLEGPKVFRMVKGKIEAKKNDAEFLEIDEDEEDE